MLLVLFIFVTSLFLLRLPSLLLSLITLEVLSFLCIFILLPSIFSGFVVVLLFCCFVFLAVTGVIGFYTLLSHTGSDYVASCSSLTHQN